MDLKTYWLALKAGWLIVLGVVAVMVAAALLLSWPSASSYASTTRLFIAADAGSADLTELTERNAVAAQRLASYVELARSGTVADEVGAALDTEVDSADVVAIAVPGTVVMSLTVTNADAEAARDIAAGYAEVMPGIIEELEEVRDSDGPQVRALVIDEANLPTSPLPTTLIRNLVAAIMLGLGLGLGLAVLRYVLKDTNKPQAQESNPT